eukprot:5219225-Prymnesium_polylepis.1
MAVAAAAAEAEAVAVAVRCGGGIGAVCRRERCGGRGGRAHPLLAAVGGGGRQGRRCGGARMRGGAA